MCGETVDWPDGCNYILSEQPHGRIFYELEDSGMTAIHIPPPDNWQGGEIIEPPRQH